MTWTRLGLIGVLCAACSAGCGGRYFPGGAAVLDGRVRYLVFHDQGTGELLELDCEPAAPSATHVDCRARAIRFAPPATSALSLTGAEAEAARAAAGCPISNVSIQSGDAATGYWLYVCGVQRFYRRNEAGTWIDATPEPAP